MINKAVLMGRLTKAPELRYTQSNVPVTAFALAVERNYAGPDGTRPTDFINCVAWRSTGEFVSKYFGKGDLIAVSGSIQTRKYTDKDGINRVAVEVIVDEVSFTGEKKERQTAPTPVLPRGDFADIADDDDLPF